MHLQCRVHDEREPDEIHRQIGVDSQGIQIYRKELRPNSSILESWHEREIRLLGTHNGRVGILMGSFLVIYLIVETNITAEIKFLGARNFGLPDAPYTRYRNLDEMMAAAKGHPTVFTPESLRFLRGLVKKEKDTGERFAGLWESPYWDELRAGGKKTADILGLVLERDRQQREQGAGKIMVKSDIQTACAVAQPMYGEYLAGRQIEDAGSLAKFERTETELANLQLPERALTVAELTAVVEHCFGKALEPDELQRMQLVFSNGLDNEVQPATLEHQWMELLRRISSSTSGDLFQRIREEGFGKQSQQQIVAQIQGVRVNAFRGIHAKTQHNLFQRAYLSLPEKTFPSDARVLKQYNTELDIAAQLAVLNGDADTTEQFTTANAILLSDVSSYKEKLRSGAQAKRNASNCNGVDQR